MKLFEIVVRRPFLITILNLIIFFFGLISFFNIPIDLMPDVDFPIVSVIVPYPGADPETIEKDVLEPLEDALSSLKQLDSINATAQANQGLIVLMFDLERNGDDAFQDVNEIMAFAKNVLPSGAEDPLVRKYDPTSMPFLFLSVRQTEELQKATSLNELIEKVIKPNFEQIEDVGEVVVLGNRQEEVHINLIYDRLKHYRINASSISSQLQGFLQDLPGGVVEDQKKLIRLKTVGTFKNLEEMKRFPILTGTGAKIPLQDLAEIKFGLEDETRFSALNNQPAIGLFLRKKSGGNTVQAAKDVKEKIKKLKSLIPKGVSIDISRDNAIYIEQSLGSVKTTLFQAAILTVLIILLFLYSWKSAFLSLLTIPASILGTFLVIFQKEFTLNNLTSLGLTLSVGLLVDDAIVVIENIFRYFEKGKDRFQAAIEGTSEIILPVLATTLTIVAVFIPVAFMEGILGRFFYQFGITIAVAVVFSTFVALTLVPMLSPRLFREQQEESPSLFFLPFKKLNQFLLKWYEIFLKWSVQKTSHQLSILGLGVFFFILSLVLLKFVPKSFFPNEDRSFFTVSLRLPPETSLSGTREVSNEISDYIRKEWPEEVTHVITTIGGGQKGTHESTLDVLLKDPHERSRMQSEIQMDVRKKVADKFAAPGRRILISNERGGGGGEYTQPIQITLQGNDQEVLDEYVNQIIAFTKENVKGTADVTSTMPPTLKNLEFQIQPRLLSDHFLNNQTVAQNLYTMFSGKKVGSLTFSGINHDLVVRLRESDRKSEANLSNLHILNQENRLIPFSIFSQTIEKDIPSVISRKNGFKEITLLADFNGPDLLGAINQIVEQIKNTKPEGIFYNLQGEAELMADSMQAMLQAMVIAILMVLMILWAQFEAFIPPLLIILSIPLAFSGAFLALLVSQKSLGIYAMIGLILLIGIVTKNAIILVDFILVRVREGLTAQEAVCEACPIRLRPIIMTSFATIFAMLPVALGRGIGSEARSPMGTAVMGGMISSAFLTLLVIPNAFLLWTSLKVWFKRRLNL